MVHGGPLPATSVSRTTTVGLQSAVSCARSVTKACRASCCPMSSGTTPSGSFRVWWTAGGLDSRRGGEEASTGERKRGTHFSLTADLGLSSEGRPGRWSQNIRWPVLVRRTDWEETMTAIAESISVTGSSDRRRRIVAIVGASSGNLVEWYDFYAYAFTSIYFASAFFPSGDATSQLLATAGIFAVGFFMRPLGGWLFGWIADTHGRRSCADRLHAAPACIRHVVGSDRP